MASWNEGVRSAPGADSSRSLVRLLAVVIALVAVVAAVAGSARAGVPTWAAQCANDPNVASCERLTFIAETVDSINTYTAEMNVRDAATATDTHSTYMATVDVRHGTAWTAGLLMVVVATPFLVSFLRRTPAP